MHALTSRGQMRSIDSVDGETSQINASKRLCRDPGLSDCDMLDANRFSLKAPANCSNGNVKSSLLSSRTVSADEILVQMIQSGSYSREQVVDFCIETGIPLSRMLRLDLMRLSNVQP